MTSEDDNPLGSLQQLELLLRAEGYDSTRPAMSSIRSLRSALQDQGYKETVIPPPSVSYTIKRAQALRSLSVKLRDTLRGLSSSPSYSDKAVALSVVSNSYLQLAHAFKVDTKVWSFAQEDLVPILSAAVDETSLDDAFSKLLSHLDRYVDSLDKWLVR
jgi:hypothetical protein